MRARGIDSGKAVGWCDIERVSVGVFDYIASGTWDASEIRRGMSLPVDSVGIDVTVIETPREVHPHSLRASSPAKLVQMVRDLLDARAVAERIACNLAGECPRVIEPTAGETRRALNIRIGGQKRRGEEETADQQIAAIIPLAVRGWPKRSNKHVRDAAVAALYGLEGGALADVVAAALRQARA